MNQTSTKRPERLTPNDIPRRFEISPVVLVKCLVCLRRVSEAQSVWNEGAGGVFHFVGNICKGSGCLQDYARKFQAQVWDTPKALD